MLALCSEHGWTEAEYYANTTLFNMQMSLRSAVEGLIQRELSDKDADVSIDDIFPDDDD